VVDDSTGVIILAAGKGTRMQSTRAKVLHPLAGRPIIAYVLDTALKIAGPNTVVVVGNQANAVRQKVAEQARVSFAYQEEQLGTGHAVQCAMPALASHIRNVLILCGDVPLITEQTLSRLLYTHLQANNAVTLLGVNLDNPKGYGRVATDAGGNVRYIVEEADATEAEKNLKIINSGIYSVRRDFLEAALAGLRPDNAQKEIYLTDIIGIAVDAAEPVGMLLAEEYSELLGINTLEDLQFVEALLPASGKNLDFEI